jgi:hypothetical protein
MKENGTHFLMVVARVVLGDVISQVYSARRPVNFEFVLV